MLGLALLLDLIAQPTFGLSSFSPAEFPWDKIQHSDGQTRQQLLEALESSGMLSVTDIPSFASLRPAVLAAAHRCSSTQHDRVKTSVFPDGTARRTLALPAALPNSGISSLPLQELSSLNADCTEFARLAADFRQLLDTVSMGFARVLSEAVAVRVGPAYSLLYQRPADSAAAAAAYRTIEDIVVAGAHLDHFHSYSSAKAAASGQDEQPRAPTIEMHTDQGLFIAVAPALMVAAASGQPNGHTAGRFLAQLPQSKEAQEVLLNGDALFLMMGDGVDQFVNGALRSAGGRPLLAVPHALVMPDSSQAEPEARVWFGRMYLPPDDAVHPQAGVSFGKLKTLLNNQPNEGSAESSASALLSMGCSDGKTVRRVMTADACNPTNQIYCWFRCYDFTPTANPEYCASQSMGFNCTSDAWDGIYQGGHGAFTPRCTNSTTLEKDLVPPPVPKAPETCDFNETLFMHGEGYNYMMTLKQNKSFFMWREQRKPAHCTACAPMVDGALVVKGNVGWLALGIANPEGEKKGMQGGHVLIGIVSDGGTTERIAEYVINPVTTPFDTWNAHVPQTVSDKSMTINECATVLSFSAKAIAGWNFNTTKGTRNNLIWAADPVYRGIKTTFRGTEYIGYHAQGLRGAFDVDFHDETWWVKGVSGQGTPAPLLGVSGQQAASEQEVQDLTVAVIVIGVVLGLAVLVLLGLLVWHSRVKNAAASPYNKKQAPKGDGGGMVSEGVNLKNYNRQPSRDQVEVGPSGPNTTTTTDNNNSSSNNSKDNSKSNSNDNNNSNNLNLSNNDMTLDTTDQKEGLTGSSRGGQPGQA
eukprot:g589.t1